MIFAFDDWELDAGLFELRRNGEPQKIEPQAFDLLTFLIRNRGRVVTRDEMVAAIWGGRIVTEATISTCLKAARQAIGDDGRTQRYIKTAHGRGFRFVGAVIEPPAPSPAEAKAEAPAPAAPSPWTTLSLLPFDVFSDDPALEFFADGLVEDLTTILARAPDLTVISRSSSFAYKGRSPDARRVRDDLGASHMIEGSVRAGGERLRINVQLIDTADGAHVWAERFDRPRAEAEELGDEIIHAIARRVEPQLAKASYERARRSACDQDAMRLYREASGLLAVKGWRPATFAEAADLLRRSLEIEAGFARAHAYLSFILAFGQRVGLISDREASVAESRTAGDRALELDDGDSTVLGFVGCALSDIGETQRSLPILEAAVAQDPSNAQAWAALGSSRVLMKSVPEGVADLRRGVRLSPLDNRLAIWRGFLAFAMMLDGDVKGALAEAEAACRQDTRNHMPRVMLAAIATAAGDHDRARAAMDEARRVRPELTETEIALLVGARGLNAMNRFGLLQP